MIDVKSTINNSRKQRSDIFSEIKLKCDRDNQTASKFQKRSRCPNICDFYLNLMKIGAAFLTEYKLYHKQTAAMTALLGNHANTDRQLRYKRSADCDSAKWRTKKCKIVFGTIICTFLQRKWQTCFAHVFLNFWRFVQRLVDRFQVMFIRLVGLVLL